MYVDRSALCCSKELPPMKFITTTFLIALMAFASVLPINAQKADLRSRSAKTDSPKTNIKTETAQDGIRLASVEAFSDGNGSFIRWSMERETGNLGFYVYRIDANGRTLINENLISGSALSVNDRTLEGTQYRYFDAKGSVGSTYIVQSVLQNGNKIDSPAFSSAYVGNTSQIAGADDARKDAVNNAVPTTAQKLLPNLPKEVITEIENNQLAADPVIHKWVIQQPGVRIGVRSEGMFRVTAGELTAGGFNTASNSANWQLYKDGVQQAINIGPSDSYIEFYGKGLDQVETDEQMYYLIEGPTAGKRIQSRVMRRVGSTVVIPNNEVSLNFKERTSYVNAILNGSASNFWVRCICIGDHNSFHGHGN